MSEMTFTFRPATPGDAAFLYDLHVASMREAIAATWGWDEAWQRDHFSAQFTPERIQLIQVSGEVVGMLELDDRPTACFIVNLKILPAFQSRGLGTAVLRQVLASAANRRVPVQLQVLKLNKAARRLYGRLGFVATGQTPAHLQMESPAAAGNGD